MKNISAASGENVFAGTFSAEKSGEVKKLDFDFGDTDDFFNSFDNKGVTKVESNTFGNEFSME